MEWCSMDVDTCILCWASRQNRAQSSVWKVAQLDSVGLRQSWGRSRAAASQEIRRCWLFLPSQMHRVHTHPVCWMPFLVLPSIYAQAFQTVSDPPLLSLSLPPPKPPFVSHGPTSTPSFVWHSHDVWWAVEIFGLFVVQTILLLPNTLRLCFTSTHSTRQGYCFVWLTLYLFR